MPANNQRNAYITFQDLWQYIPEKNPFPEWSHAFCKEHSQIICSGNGHCKREFSRLLSNIFLDKNVY